MQKLRIDRGDPTREKLLAASVDIFGRYGFDGATTRMLSEAASVNQQAIPYYFGGKEGLYIAAAEFIADAVGQHVAPVRERIRSRLQSLHQGPDSVSRDEARTLLAELLETMVALFVSKEAESWARFLIREQMEPTEAFRRVYDSVMNPILEIVSRLVGILLRENPQSEHVRLRTLSLMGSILIFRMAHAAVLAKLEWQSIGHKELTVIQALVRELVASIDAGKNKS